MNRKHFILPFLLALLFSSCSILENTAFEKRKYRPGFYVSTHSSPKIQEEKNSSLSPEAEKEENYFSSEKTAGLPTETTQQVKEDKIKPEKIISGVVSHKLTTSQKKNGVKQKFETKLQERVSAFHSKKYQRKREMEGIDGDTIIIFFVVLLLTLLYTAEILSEDPGMPVGLAFLLGLLCTLISLLTGEILIL